MSLDQDVMFEDQTRDLTPVSETVSVWTTKSANCTVIGGMELTV